MFFHVDTPGQMLKILDVILLSDSAQFLSLLLADLPSLVNQAVWSINLTFIIIFLFHHFNILFLLQKGEENVKNDGKEKIIIKVSLID